MLPILPNPLRILVGSYLDTVPCGGRLDGSIGLLAALEVLRTLNDLRIATSRPISQRRCVAALWQAASAKIFFFSHRDSTGRTIEDEVTRIGSKRSASARLWLAHCHLELHIK